MTNRDGMRPLLAVAALMLALAPPARVVAQASPMPVSSDATASAARRAAAALVQVGDRIVLHVLREPELTQTATVNERVEVVFAKIGTVNLSATPIGALQDTLRRRYSRYLRDPAIDAVVLRRVIVHGDVRVPNVYLVDVTTTLRDVIAMAGGMLESANAKNITIVRDQQRIPVPNWVGDQTLASDLKSGDEIIVGRKNWLVLNALSATSVATLVASVAMTFLRR
jgi:protein involved in polysaccharide export with SLBB domain